MRRYIGTIRRLNDKMIGIRGLSVKDDFALRQTMGRLLESDIGKRAYRVGDIVQVENDAQRDERDLADLHIHGR